MVSVVVVNRTKSRDIFESAILVMITSVLAEGSSPVLNHRSSYCIGHGDWISAMDQPLNGRLTVRLIADSTTWSLIDNVAEP